MDKNFKIGVDLDDSQYRERLNRLMEDTQRITSSISGGQSYPQSFSNREKIQMERLRAEQLQQQFRSQYSQADVDLARRRAQNPFSGQMSERDARIVQEYQQIQELNKNLKELIRLEQVVNLYNSRRHEEYKNLTNKQLDIERTKLKKELSGGKLSPAEQQQYQEALDFINQELSRRKTDSSEAIKRFGKNFFMSQMIGGVGGMFGREGGFVTNSLSSGVDAFGAMRMGGASIGAAVGVAAAITAIKSFSEAVVDGDKMIRSYYKTAGVIGNKGISTGYSSLAGKFSSLGISEKDYTQLLQEFVQSTGYTNRNDLLGQAVLRRSVTMKALGIDEGDYASFYRMGGFGSDYMNPQSGIYGFAKFLESRNIGGIKVGIGPNGELSSDRNMVRMPEYLKKLVDINEAMYRATGVKSEAQTQNAMNLFGSFLNLGGIFGRADIAGEVLEGMRANFSNPKSQLAEFYNYQAYRQIKGGGSNLQDYYLTMENMDNVDIMNARMEQFRRRLGGKKLDEVDPNIVGMVMGELSTITGLSQHKATELYKKFEEGKLTKVDIKPEESPAVKIENSALRLTTELEKSISSFESSVQEFKKGVAAFVNKAIGDEDSYEAAALQAISLPAYLLLRK